jgi:hypothetical protein
MSTFLDRPLDLCLRWPGEGVGEAGKEVLSCELEADKKDETGESSKSEVRCFRNLHFLFHLSRFTNDVSQLTLNGVGFSAGRFWRDGQASAV